MPARLHRLAGLVRRVDDPPARELTDCGIVIKAVDEAIARREPQVRYPARRVYASSNGVSWYANYTNSAGKRVRKTLGSMRKLDEAMARALCEDLAVHFLLHPHAVDLPPTKWQLWDVARRSSLRTNNTQRIRTTALDASHAVLRLARQPMSCEGMIAAMRAMGLWSSPRGKTPARTLSAEISREIKTKGTAARIQKSGPGRFVANVS